MPEIYVKGAFGCAEPVDAAVALAGLLAQTPWTGVAGPGVAITPGGVAGHAPTIGVDMSTLPLAAACALSATLVAGDNQVYGIDALRSHAVFGVSPLVINPTSGAPSAWALGQSESTPITTLTLTNPSPCRSMVVELKVFHMLYVRDSAFESPKVNSLAAQSLISVDDGAGTLQLLPLYPNSFGNSQLSAIVVRSDPGQNNNSGNQVSITGLLYVTLPPGATRTFRSRSTLTVMDSGTGTFWTVTQLAALGISQ